MTKHSSEIEKSKKTPIARRKRSVKSDPNKGSVGATPAPETEPVPDLPPQAASQTTSVSHDSNATAAAPVGPAMGDSDAGKLLRTAVTATMRAAASEYIKEKGIGQTTASGEVDFSSIKDEELGKHGPGLIQAMFGALSKTAATMLPNMTNAPWKNGTTDATPATNASDNVIPLRPVVASLAEGPSQDVSLATPSAPIVAQQSVEKIDLATTTAPQPPRPPSAFERQIGEAVRDAFQQFVAENLAPRQAASGDAGPVRLGPQDIVQHGGALVRNVLNALARVLVPVELRLGSMPAPAGTTDSVAAARMDPSAAAEVKPTSDEQPATSPTGDVNGKKRVPIQLDLGRFFEGIFGWSPSKKT